MCHLCVMCYFVSLCHLCVMCCFALLPSGRRETPDNTRATHVRSGLFTSWFHTSFHVRSRSCVICLTASYTPAVEPSLRRALATSSSLVCTHLHVLENRVVQIPMLHATPHTSACVHHALADMCASVLHVLLHRAGSRGCWCWCWLHRCCLTSYPRLGSQSTSSAPLSSLEHQAVSELAGEDIWPMYCCKACQTIHNEPIVQTVM